MRLTDGGQLEDGEQKLLGRRQQQAVLHGGEEGGGHVADEGDERLQVAGVRQRLGLGQRCVKLLDDLLHVDLADQRLWRGAGGRGRVWRVRIKTCPGRRDERRAGAAWPHRPRGVGTEPG